MPKHLNSADDYEMVPIGRLKLHPRNVNQSDMGAVIESIKAHGFYGALVVQRGTCFVCVGNHRLLAARELGFDALPVTWIDCDAETALRVMVADNRTTRLGNDNPAALAELLAELAGTETGLGAVGYDGDALDQLISDLATPLGHTAAKNDPNAEWEGMPEYAHEDARPFRSFNIHFGSQEAVDEFSALIEQKITPEAKWIWHPKQVRNNFMQERWVSTDGHEP